MEEREISPRELAAKLGISVMSAYRLRDGKTPGRADIQVKIRKLTGGNVCPNDLIEAWSRR